MSFSNELNQFYEVYFDFLDYIGQPSPVIPMIDGLKLRSTGGDEDKFAPILGTECLLNIAVGKYKSIDDSQLTISDLIAEHDNDIRITVYKDQDYTKSVFQGFVVVEDNSQPFLDPPFNLNIRALDCLGLLKGVDLTDFNNELFTGRLSIQDWVGNILMKTGQTLNIRFYFPIYPSSVHVDMSTGIPIPSIIPDTYSPLSRVFLDAITFQQGELTTTTDPSVDVKASEADDCYTALEKIMRCLRCRLFQQDGVWNVVNIYSYMNPNGYSYHEAAAGTLTDGKYSFSTVATASGQKYDTNVGRNGVIHMVKDDAMRYLKLATKWVKLTYNYDQSLNKVCNQGLTQLGEYNSAYDGTTPDEDNPTITDITKGYEAFCFSHRDGGASSFVGIYPDTTPAKRGYIRTVLDALGYERDRYLVLEKTTGSVTFFRSTKIFIDRSDILQVSFQFRPKEPFTTSIPTGFVEAYIFLYGDNGTYWALRSVGDASVPGNPNVWIQTDSNFHASGGTPIVGNSQITEYGKNWESCTVNQGGDPSVMAFAPVSGEVEVLFSFDNDSWAGTGGGVTELWFKNIQIGLLPFLQGSYQQLKGDYNYSTSANNIKQTQSEDVQISDSPKRYFKGALVDSDGELIQPNWHRIGFTESYRFTQIMEYLIYTNTNRIMEKIEGTFRGLTYRTADLEVKQYGYLNSYFFPDHPMPTKKFMLTSFDDDYGTGYGRRVFVEVLQDQNDPGFDVPDAGNYLFQYLFQ